MAEVYTCDECGFRWDLGEAERAPDTITAGVNEIRTLLDGHAADGDLARRRAADVWSPLEYGCHVRDVLLVQRERVLAARRTDQPAFDPMGRDERVDHDGYAEQDPADVVRQLGDAALLFANVLRRLEPEEWDRTVVYSYPSPWVRPLRWVAVHTVHEMHHHIGDIRGQFG